VAEAKFLIDEAFKKAWEIFSKNAGILIVCALLYLGLGAILNMLSGMIFARGHLWLLLVYITQIFLQAWLLIGFIRISLRLLDGKKADLSVLFSGFDIIVPFAIAWFLFAIGFGVGLVMLVVPGFIFGTIFGFTHFLVVDKGLKPIEAFYESARLTKNHRLQLFAFFLLIACFNLLGVLALGIGLLFTIPISAVAMAFVYRRFSH
jgi:uncharacterized membrane protein